MLCNLTFPAYAQDDENGSLLFKDVPYDHWGIGPIALMNNLYLIKGFPDGSFKPNANVTREQFAALLCNALKLKFPLRIKQSFADVPEKKWSFPYVETVKPYLDGFYGAGGRKYFKPTIGATRTEVAAAIIKALNYKTTELKNKNILKEKFSDYGKIPENNRSYVALAVENNLIDGFPDKTFKGNAPLTRAQAAVILSKVISPEFEEETGILLEVTAPTTTSTNIIYINGVTDPKAQVFINGVSVSVNNGKFSSYYKLDKEGTYEYTIEAKVPGGKSTKVKKVVKYELPKPVLTINALPKISSTKTIKVSGKVISNGGIARVTLNDNLIASTASGTFNVPITLHGGENLLTFVATNIYGKSVKVTRIVYFDDGGPALYVESTPDTTPYKEIRILGEITDKNDPYPQLYFNNKLVQQWEDGTFEVVTSLEKGENTLTFKAIDRHGKTTTIIRKITFKPELPVLIIADIPAFTTSTSITVTGKVSDLNDEYPKLYINGKPVRIGSDGSFSTSVSLIKGDNYINFKLTNSLGDEVTSTKKITMVYPPSLKVNSIPEVVAVRNITVSGVVSDVKGDKVTVTLNDQWMSVDNKGNFYKIITLKDGENVLTFKAVNEHGLTTTVVKKVTCTAKK